MSELAVMDRTGDTRIEWDAERPGEVEAARELFDKMKNKGYLAYTLDRSGTRGDVIRRFDPNAERIIMSPQTVGG